MNLSLTPSMTLYINYKLFINHVCIFFQNPEEIDTNVPYIAINETIMESIDSTISNFSFI